MSKISVLLLPLLLLLAHLSHVARSNHKGDNFFAHSKYLSRNAPLDARLTNPTSLTSSPDGNYVYAVENKTSAVIRWKRDANNDGGLTERIDYVNDVSLRGVTAIVIAPDGFSAFAVAAAANTLVYWDRDVEGGTLYNERTIALTATNHRRPRSVAVSDDGGNVYVVAHGMLVHWATPASRDGVRSDDNTVATTRVGSFRCDERIAFSLSCANRDCDVATNLQACSGECDDDDQCAEGLKCFQREGSEAIPGCRSGDESPGDDFCYDPKYAEPFSLFSNLEQLRSWKNYNPTILDSCTGWNCENIGDTCTDDGGYTCCSANSDDCTDGSCWHPSSDLSAVGSCAPNYPTKKSIRHNCARACLSSNARRQARESEYAFLARGFVMWVQQDKDFGRCLCETEDSASCTRDTTGHYDRYDYKDGASGNSLTAPGETLSFETVINDVDLHDALVVAVAPCYARGQSSNVYVGTERSIVSFVRNVVDGQLDQKQVLADPTKLQGSSSFAFSPNGMILFVAVTGYNAVASYVRNSVTGALNDRHEVVDPVHLNSVHSVECSPDGTKLYAASNDVLVSWDLRERLIKTTLIGPFECGREDWEDEQEILMYEDSDKNPGTDMASWTQKCAEKCIAVQKNHPLFVLRGVIVGTTDSGIQGRCFCESQDSAICKQISGS